MKLILALLVICLSLSGCSSHEYQKEAADYGQNGLIPSWCERDWEPSARQTYECEKLFRKEDARRESSIQKQIGGY